MFVLISTWPPRIFQLVLTREQLQILRISNSINSRVSVKADGRSPADYKTSHRGLFILRAGFHVLVSSYGPLSGTAAYNTIRSSLWKKLLRPL